MNDMQVPRHQRDGGQKRANFDRVVLLLQGGGALGAYQAGVYQALAEADLHPDWVAGISIGAVNAAIIAGNPPEKRVERLRAFWEGVSATPFGVPDAPPDPLKSDLLHRFTTQAWALGSLFGGAPGFFTPRFPLPVFGGGLGGLSYYDVAPLRQTLNDLIDFDLVNAGQTRLSVGAVNVATGNFEYFDTQTHHLGPEHVMASGALPPGFPAVEIDGEFYWDGGIVSNTPLQWVLDSTPRKDTLAFQIDLWSARGELPTNLMEIELRQKEIRFSSRTRAATDQFKKAQIMRRAAAKLLAQLPEDLRASPEAKTLAREADETVCNIVHLIYRSKSYEGTSLDFEFSRWTMEEHWQTGYEDAMRSLAYPEVLQRPEGLDGVFVFDLSAQHRP